MHLLQCNCVRATDGHASSSSSSPDPASIDYLLRSWLYPVAQMLAEASTSMLGNCGCNRPCGMLGNCGFDRHCCLLHQCKPECSCHHRRRSTIGHGLSKGETKRDMRRGVYMHIVRFEPAVPSSSRIPHDPLSNPICARQKQITMCFPSPPCMQTPPHLYPTTKFPG